MSAGYADLGLQIVAADPHCGLQSHSDKRLNPDYTREQE